MTGTRKTRSVLSSSGTWHPLLDTIGRGALRGMRLENMANSGPRHSGTDVLRITIDRLRVSLTSGMVLGSGQLQVPYIGADRGIYLNLSQFVMSADYHESGILFSGYGNCDCMAHQRIPYHENCLVEYYLNTSGVRASGMDITVWYEGKV